MTQEKGDPTGRPYGMLCRYDGLWDRRGRLSHRLWLDFYYRAVREPPLRYCEIPALSDPKIEKGENPKTLVTIAGVVVSAQNQMYTSHIINKG